MNAAGVLLGRVGRWRFEGGTASSFPTAAGPVLTVHHKHFIAVIREHHGRPHAALFEGSRACARRVLEGLAAAVREPRV